MVLCTYSHVWDHVSIFGKIGRNWQDFPLEIYDPVGPPGRYQNVDCIFGTWYATDYISFKPGDIADFQAFTVIYV